MQALCVGMYPLGNIAVLINFKLVMILSSGRVILQVFTAA